MTLKEIAAFLTKADPLISHYESMEQQGDYTFWEETRPLSFMADGSHQGGWRFYVHRYTGDEEDPVTERIRSLLEASDRIAYSETSDYVQETGQIHHIFECEGF